MSLAQKPKLREALFASKPEWEPPIKMDGSIFRNPHFNQPMIDHFRLFNGLGGDNTVAKKIENIIVPSLKAKHEAESYIRANQDRFSYPPPRVGVFGSQCTLARFFPCSREPEGSFSMKSTNGSS